MTTPAFIDYHAHLEHEAFASDLPAAIKRAREAGVARTISAGSSAEANKRTLEIRKAFPDDVEAVLGIAPHNYAVEDLGAQLKFVRAHASEIVGIGEIGLDLHHFGPETLGDQKKVFTAQLELAEEMGLPVVIHSRKAEQEVFDLLQQFQAVKVMLHFFLLPKFASLAAGRGWLVSLPTIKSSSKHKIAGELPLEALACETDSPFGLGAGLRSEPKDVTAAYAEIAAEKKKPVEVVAESVCANAEKFFGIELLK